MLLFITFCEQFGEIRIIEHSKALKDLLLRLIILSNVSFLNLYYDFGEMGFSLVSL